MRQDVSVIQTCVEHNEIWTKMKTTSQTLSFPRKKNCGGPGLIAASKKKRCAPCKNPQLLGAENMVLACEDGNLRVCVFSARREPPSAIGTATTQLWSRRVWRADCSTSSPGGSSAAKKTLHHCWPNAAICSVRSSCDGGSQPAHIGAQTTRSRPPTESATNFWDGKDGARRQTWCLSSSRNSVEGCSCGARGYG